MSQAIERLGPIEAAPLLARVDAHLLELLRGLDASDWERATMVPGWSVRDIACHLLDGALRKLSIVRDGHVPTPPQVRSNADLVALVNRLNAEGVAFYRRSSARVLISLLERATAESAAFHESLDPSAPAAFAVSWAGESTSANWFDTARELTERWHHQQQIREAVGRPGIMTKELYLPVLDCFMRALPHHYRAVDAAPGACLVFTVAGAAGGRWHLVREGKRWLLSARAVGDITSETTIPEGIAWRLFTKGIARDEALAQLTVTGDRPLGLHILELVAIVG